jgi:hypothetical protein
MHSVAWHRSHHAVSCNQLQQCCNVLYLSNQLAGVGCVWHRCLILPLLTVLVCPAHVLLSAGGASLEDEIRQVEGLWVL